MTDVTEQRGRVEARVWDVVLAVFGVMLTLSTSITGYFVRDLVSEIRSLKGEASRMVTVTSLMQASLENLREDAQRRDTRVLRNDQEIRDLRERVLALEKSFR